MASVEFVADTTPILGFLELLKARAEFADGLFRLSDLGFELFRIEQNIDSAGARKITVVFYPSDAFIRYVGAIVAGNRNIEVVE